MEHVGLAIIAIEKAIKKANGRRKKRLLRPQDIFTVILPPEQKFMIVRDYSVDGYLRRGRFRSSKRQGKTTAALIFRDSDRIYVLMRAVRAPKKNGFTELVWGGRWRKKAAPFELEKDKPLWLPTAQDRAIYSDYLEERGLPRVA